MATGPLKPDDPRTGRRRRQVAAKCGHVRSQRPMTILDRNCSRTVGYVLAICKHARAARTGKACRGAELCSAPRLEMEQFWGQTPRTHGVGSDPGWRWAFWAE